MTEEIILPDSPEAAAQKTMTLWVSRNGRAYVDEGLARWDGCTHTKCECGGICEKPYTKCSECRDRQRAEKYAAMPFKEWDGVTPLCLFRTDTYFWSQDYIDDYCEEHDLKPESLKLVICESARMPVLTGDFFEDQLSEDGELPEELQKAINDFNAAVAAYKEPLSWHEGKFRCELKLSR